MPSRKELVANNRTEQEISDYIGADLTIFQTLPDLVASCSQFNPSITQFDCSVFTGEYVTGGVDAAYLQGLEDLRNDNAKIKAERSGAGPAMVSVNGGKNNSDRVLETQPLGDVSGGGEVAGGGDISQVVGLNNESPYEAEQPSGLLGLGNEHSSNSNSN
jgi:amidophosphoribosyltransferase